MEFKYNYNGDQYAYDANGNLNKDLNKNISNITYNCLNLPELISFNNGDQTRYIYDASGVKHQMTYYNRRSGFIEVTKSYLSNRVYNNGNLTYTLTEEGFLDGNWRTPFYYVKDHLGSNRVSFYGAGSVIEFTDYYPFGLNFAQKPPQSDMHVPPYRFNGKELDKELSLYDYGARMYDPALGRFMTMDPMAEKYYSTSPYAYCANNPVNNVDLRGDSITTVVTSTVNGVTSNTTYNYGKDANGNYGFLDSSGQLYSGGDQYVANLTTALGNLRGGSKGQALVDNLTNSTSIVQIGQPRGSQTNSADPNGTYILWDPSSTNGGPDQTGSTARPTYIGLGHEMAHIQDVWNGTYDASTWATVGPKAIPNAEKYATHVENQLRSENGISLRTHYSPGFNSTRILQPKTNASLFYKRAVNLGGTLISTTPYIY